MANVLTLTFNEISVADTVLNFYFTQSGTDVLRSEIFKSTRTNPGQSSIGIDNVSQAQLFYDAYNQDYNTTDYWTVERIGNVVTITSNYNLDIFNVLVPDNVNYTLTEIIPLTYTVTDQRQTLSYSDKAKGWNSFQPYKPDWMGKLNNRFFAIKDGNLFLMNDQTNPVRNNFFEEQFDSSITTVINVEPSEDKIFKTIVEESKRPWAVALKTNLTEGTITAEEFNARESRYFAHIRQNESTTDYHGHAVQGIGNIVSFENNDTVTMEFAPELVNVGDILFQLAVDNTEQLIGEITAINGVSITVTVTDNDPEPGYYAYAKKNFRVEGGEMRGKYMEITLTNSDTEPVDLTAVSSNVVKSYV